MNLKTGVLSVEEAAGGDWIEVDSAKATLRQLTDLRVSIYDRNSTLGRELSFRRAQRGIKDGLSAAARKGSPGLGRGITQMNIDVGLAVLCALKPEHVQLGQAEIAEVCGCSRETIRKIESSALEKLKKSPVAQLIYREVCA